MESKSLGKDNLLYEREQSKDFSITDSTNSNENKEESGIYNLMTYF